MTVLRRVGLNAVFLEPRMGGLETYTLRLLPELIALRPDVRFILFLNQHGRAVVQAEPWADEVGVVTRPLLGRRYVRALSEAVLLGPLAARHELDLLHSVAMTGPPRPPVAHVVTLGDLIWLHHPETVDRLTRVAWRLLVPPVVRRADRVLTFSNASRADAVSMLGVAEEKIDVVPLGPGSNSTEPTPDPVLRERLGLGDSRVVLTVSAKRSHKNLVRLVRAMRLVRRQVPDAVLVLPGNRTPHEDELRRVAAEAEVSQGVVYPEYVTPEDLEGLYGLASCFVFPSVREGFGLPVLEAMRRGLPVACASTSSLPEVAGDAARYFDPFDEGGMAAAVTALLQEPELAARLSRAGIERQALFSWRHTAEGTLESYERAHAAHRT